jgi:hypothetical protein
MTFHNRYGSRHTPSLGHDRILTTDQRDFRTYRWKSRRPFEPLLG